MILFFHLLGMQEYEECFDTEMFRSLLLSFLIGVGGIIITLRKCPLQLYLPRKIYWVFVAVGIFMWWLPINGIREFVMMWCLLLYGSSLFVREKTIKHFYCLCSFLCIGMALYGLLQYIGYAKSNHAFFRITGVFDNPAGIAMYLSVLLPYLWCCFRMCRSFSSRIMVAGGMIMAISVIFLSGSRMGILAVIVGLLSLYYHKFTRKHLIWLGIGCILLFVVFYFYKPLSSQGRLFILIITIRLLMKRPFLGYGTYGFEAYYMQEQADFFKNNPASLWSLTADDVQYPFNEFLHFIVCYGLLGTMGAIFFVGAFVYFVKKNRCLIKRYALASLCAYWVCACFSYPSSYVYVTFVMLLAVSVVIAPLAYRVNPSVSCGMKKVLMLGLPVVLLVLSSYQYCKEETKYRLEVRATNGEETEELRREYQQAYKDIYFRHSPSFLYNYAIYLYEREDYHTALSVLNQCKVYKRGYEWQMLYAYTLKHLHLMPQAIEAFELASFMIPNRMLPRYEMIHLYQDICDFEKARICAGKALEIPMKVHTAKTEYLRGEIEKMMLQFVNRKEESPMSSEK